MIRRRTKITVMMITLIFVVITVIILILTMRVLQPFAAAADQKGLPKHQAPAPAGISESVGPVYHNF